MQTGVDAVYRFDYQPGALLVGNFIPLPCLVHRRDCLDVVGGFDEQLITHEDWDLLIRLAARYPFLQLERGHLLLQLAASTAARRPASTAPTSRARRS